MYIRWAGSTTIWDFATKSFSLKLWYSYARKEGKWWKFDKLHSRHFELPGEWAPTCLSSNSAIRWEERFIFISPALPFLVWHEVCYSPSLFAKISRRYIHPGKYIFRVTKIRSNNKNLYSNHIVPNWKRNPLDGTLGICVSLTYDSCTNGRECLHSCLRPLADASGFVWLAGGPMYSGHDRGAGIS